jgi:hypothetical protein
MKEDNMYDELELKQRLVIIKHSSLDDATILDENYKQLIKNTPDPVEQEQFVILQSTVQRRIEELKGDSGGSSI